MISERKILVGCLGAEITDAHSHQRNLAGIMYIKTKLKRIRRSFQCRVKILLCQKNAMLQVARLRYQNCNFTIALKYIQKNQRAFLGQDLQKKQAKRLDLQGLKGGTTCALNSQNSGNDLHDLFQGLSKVTVHK